MEKKHGVYKEWSDDGDYYSVYVNGEFWGTELTQRAAYSLFESAKRNEEYLRRCK